MTVEELYDSVYRCATGNCSGCKRLKSSSTYECKKSVLRDTVTLLVNLIDGKGAGDCNINDIKIDSNY